MPEDPYGLSKIVVEEICRVASRRTGVPTVSLRFSWIRAEEEFAHRFPPIWEHPEYVGARDVGRSCRLALEADTEGFEAFYIAAAESYIKVPTRELVQRFFPEVTELRDGWGGYDSALSCAKARRLLGYEPQQSWREYLVRKA